MLSLVVWGGGTRDEGVRERGEPVMPYVIYLPHKHTRSLDIPL